MSTSWLHTEAWNPYALVEALGEVFGSLNASEPSRRRLVDALIGEHHFDVLPLGEAAVDFLRDAVPVERDPHPQRGWVVRLDEDERELALMTPGGVEIQLRPLRERTGLFCAVYFNRASTVAAGDLKSALEERAIQYDDGCEAELAPV